MTERKLEMAIEGILFDWIVSKEPVSNITICKKIFDKLEQAGYVQLAEDQGLPEVPEMIRDGLGYHKFIKGEPVQKVYTDAQQAMLAVNWKRIRRE